MKKTIIIAVALWVTTFCFSQKMYVSIKTGYDFQSGTEKIGGNYIQTSTTSVSFENVYYSLGKGLNIEGAFGYNFQKYLGAELGFSYLKGGNTEFRLSTLVNNQLFTSSGSMLKIIPSLVINSGYSKVNPHAKIGLIIGVNGKTETSLESISSTNKVSTVFLKDSGTAIGFKTSLGVLYSINNKFSLLAEANLTSLSYSPTKGRYTKWEENGVDKLPTINVIDKEFEYSESVSTNGVVANTNEPRKTFTERLPFSSIGINVGLQYQF